jgi:hypothetical protein
MNVRKAQESALIALQEGRGDFAVPTATHRPPRLNVERHYAQRPPFGPLGDKWQHYVVKYGQQKAVEAAVKFQHDVIMYLEYLNDQPESKYSRDIYPEYYQERADAAQMLTWATDMVHKNQMDLAFDKWQKNRRKKVKTVPFNAPFQKGTKVVNDYASADKIQKRRLDAKAKLSSSTLAQLKRKHYLDNAPSLGSWEKRAITLGYIKPKPGWKSSYTDAYHK